MGFFNSWGDVMALTDIGRRGYDTTRGVIVGGNYTAWELYYDGRPQGMSEWGYADNDDEAIAAAKLLRDKLVTEYGGSPCFLYQDPTRWEVRLR